MTRFIILAGVSVVLAGTVPHLFQSYRSSLPAGTTEAMAVAAPSGRAGEAQAPAASYLSGRSFAIDAGPSGHFEGRFRINGQTIDGLVDTGATYVAMNASTARRLGVSPAAGDYIYSVRTANGTTKAALARLDRVEIGPIRVEDVEAFILDDSAISDTLIGMSFLKKLTSYAVRNGRLELRG
ncbi:MAG: retropepsin-like aspartic protease family protein [Pararhizobium sp.]